VEPIEAQFERRKRELLDQIASANNELADEAHAREKVRALEMAIAELPPELKSPLILNALDGCSYARTGELLGISGKAVEMKVYRARILERQKLLQTSQVLFRHLCVSCVALLPFKDSQGGTWPLGLSDLEGGPLGCTCQ